MQLRLLEFFVLEVTARVMVNKNGTRSQISFDTFAHTLQVRYFLKLNAVFFDCKTAQYNRRCLSLTVAWFDIVCS